MWSTVYTYITLNITYILYTNAGPISRVIVFTTLRETVKEITDCLNGHDGLIRAVWVHREAWGGRGGGPGGVVSNLGSGRPQPVAGFTHVNYYAAPFQTRTAPFRPDRSTPPLPPPPSLSLLSEHAAPPPSTSQTSRPINLPPPPTLTHPTRPAARSAFVGQGGGTAKGKGAGGRGGGTAGGGGGPSKAGMNQEEQKAAVRVGGPRARGTKFGQSSTYQHIKHTCN